MSMSKEEKCVICTGIISEKGIHHHRRSIRHRKALFENDNEDRTNCDTILNGKYINMSQNRLLYDLIFPSFKTAVRQWARKCKNPINCNHHKNLLFDKIIYNKNSEDIASTSSGASTFNNLPTELMQTLSSSLRDQLYQQIQNQKIKSSSVPGLHPLERTGSDGVFINREKILHTSAEEYDKGNQECESLRSIANKIAELNDCDDIPIINHVTAIEEYFNIFYPYITKRLEEKLVQLHQYKLNAILHLKLIKLGERQLVKIQTTDPRIVNEDCDIDELIFNIWEELLVKFDDLQYIRNSGWSLKSINGLELEISAYNPLLNANNVVRGSHSNYNLPKFILNKKCIINVKGGVDGRCFKEAIGVKLLCMKGKNVHLERASNYHNSSTDLYGDLDFSMVSFPTELEEIKVFEAKNKVCVNVFGYVPAKNIIYPIHVGKFSNLPEDVQIDLLSKGGDALLVPGVWDILYLEPKVGEGGSMENEFGHYAFIKNLPRLLNSQMSKAGNRKIICRYCLTFYEKEGYKSHLEKCEFNCGKKGEKGITPILPSGANTFLEFPIQKKKFEIEVPYVIYADFESALVEKVTEGEIENNISDDDDEISDAIICQDENTNSPSTTTINIHEPTSFCCLTVSRNPSDPQTGKYAPYIYRGKDVVTQFWKIIQDEVRRISEICSKTNIPINIDRGAQKLIREQATHCFLCKVPFHENDRVLDHDHLTGNVRGVAHSSCNLLYRRAHFIPIVFHNGSKYDFKLVIKEIINENKKKPKILNMKGKNEFDFNVRNEDDEEIDDGDNNDSKQKKNTGKKYKENKPYISVIASSSETMISFEKSWGFHLKENGKPKPGSYGGGYMSMRFIDSFRFLSSSLSILAESLKPELKKHVRAVYQDDLHFNMACRKGIFPYEHIKSMESYNELQLPPREAFSSKLNGGQMISEEDYNFACQFYKLFGCRNLGDYSDIYMKIDVLLLADVFENFRDLCLKIYRLDPLWHYSAPGLSWNAMLQSGCADGVQLIEDYDKYLFAESAVRGGLCVVSKRLIQANNPRMKKLFDPTRPTNYLTYFDANNLYGYSMSMPLPCGNYKWLEKDNIATAEIEQLEKIKKMVCEWSDTSSSGYFLEVDLEYPEHLHDKHNDFPLCPEKLCTTKTNSIPKLISTLYNKSKYVTHVAYLQRVLAQGLVLKKVYRVLSFDQRPWLADYISLNTEYRKKAVDKFDIDFYKLMNNVIFGKCLENVRGRRDIKITYDNASIAKFIADPRFKRRIILNAETNLCMIEIGRKVVEFNKPVCIGATILDLSKCVMLDFHFNAMKKIFPNAELAYHDTDSFIYDIPCTDSHEDIYRGSLLKNREKYFDFSSLPITHPLYSNVNHKTPGKFSDELSGSIGLGFVGLRPKVYSIKVLEDNNDSDDMNEKVIKKAKGVKKNVVAMSLNFDAYKKVLMDGRDEGCESRGLYVEQFNIQSRCMELRTVKMRKLALSWDDDKRYVCADGIHTLAWGHYSKIPVQDRAELIYREGQAPIINIPLHDTQITRVDNRGRKRTTSENEGNEFSKKKKSN